MNDESAALEWLYGFTDWERGIGWGRGVSPDLGWNLGRTRWLLNAIGSPDRALTTVLIAGTKGKGSTAAIIESVLRASGARTALYTQPHLHHYRERVRLDGLPISAEEFSRLVDLIRGPVERLVQTVPEAGEPTTYEITTALALLAAAEHGADVGVLEVGLGGRLDATNCIDPDVSVLTRISYDHTQILGRTLRAIACEKVAIARAGRPLVSAPQRPAARAAIIQAAREIGAQARFVQPVPSVKSSSAEQSGLQMVEVCLGQSAPFQADLALLGEHQRENAAVAIATVEELVRQGHVSVTPAAIQQGFRSVDWPGRLEVFQGRPTIVLDGAHNGESAERLAAALQQNFDFDRLVLVLGILRDKDARAMVRALAPLASPLIATRSASPRALEPSELARLARGHSCSTLVAPDIESAFSLAQSHAGPRDLICVTGSLTLVAEARELIGQSRKA